MDLRDLSFNEPACKCRRNGVVIDSAGRFRYCACPDGAREQEQDTSGYGQYIGRSAGEVMSELQIKLRENPCTSKT